MWVITRIQATPGGAFEQALAELVEAEAALCPACRGMLEAAGVLPAHCPKCGRVRGVDWMERVEELAGHALALADMRRRGEKVLK